LIDNAVRKMPAENRLALEIEVDSSVERAPPVLAAREILQQVVNVLIEHSAKSRMTEAQARRELRITASTEFNQGRSMLHFRFDDNRAAPSTEEIVGLFNRDLHAADDSHGLGLPWAENAILAMDEGGLTRGLSGVDGAAPRQLRSASPGPVRAPRRPAAAPAPAAEGAAPGAGACD